MRIRSWSGWLLSLGMLTGCFPKGDPSAPIPTTTIAAPQKAQRLVIVLPGRGDDLKKLTASGIAGIVQAQWPDADVTLTGLTLGYYMQGNAERRLHDEVVGPALGRGYREIWLLGISMGGMGSLMYDRAHPGDIHGIVLLAPYLGDKPLLQEIESAGGIATWNAGPVPPSVTADNFQRELWRHVQGWQRDPSKTTNVWLGYGNRDRLGEGFKLLSPVLPSDHVLVRDGGHAWSVWAPAAEDITARIARERATQRSP